MPRVIQPGGGSGKMRVRYRAQEAWPRCRLEAHDRGGMTLLAAAEELCVSAANLSKWASQGMGEIDHLDKILRSKKGDRGWPAVLYL